MMKSKFFLVSGGNPVGASAAAPRRLRGGLAPTGLNLGFYQVLFSE